MADYNKRMIRPNPSTTENIVSGDFTITQNAASTGNTVDSVTFTRTIPSDIWTKTSNNLAWQFTAPQAGATYTIEARGGAGSSAPSNSSCGGSCSGFAGELVTISGFVPGGSNIVFYAGNRGDAGGSCSVSDCTGGGSGGATYIMYQDALGPLSWNGTNYTPIIMAKGGQAGNDTCFNGCFGWINIGTTTDTNAFVSKFGANPANGTTYSRAGATAYGGHPWGIGADDTADYGGGLGSHYVNPSFTVVSETGGGSTSFIGGYIKFTGDFSNGTTVIP